MTYSDLNKALADLNLMIANLEEVYLENGGEVTPETEAAEAQISSLRDFLSTEGVDVLGRWLKAKEDEKKALKAEKDYISRKVASVDNTIDFIKGRLSDVMKAANIEKAKGDHGYSFTRSLSTTTSVDKEILSARYGKAVEAFKETLPAYITLTLGASVSAAKDGVQKGDEGIFQTTEKDTITFRKPRAAKEE
jgi:hypothetical protein